MEEQPTWVRWRVVTVTALVAICMYLDRVCFGFAAGAIQQDFSLSSVQIGYVHSAFFWSYALLQVPCGWLGQRYGIRLVLTASIILWSLCTGMLGLATGLMTLLIFRLGIGISQAGAYPCASRAVRDWLPFAQRGTGSAIVSFGGRIGGAIAPLLTGAAMLAIAQSTGTPTLQSSEVLQPRKILQELAGANDPPTVAWLPPSLSADPELIALWRRVQDTPEAELEVRNELTTALNQRGLATALQADRASLPPEIARLVPIAASALTADALSTADRRLWERAFPTGIKKYEARGWRWTLILFGLSGLTIAILFLIVFRDLPSEHPGCNVAEQHLIADGAPPVMKSAPAPFQLHAFVFDISLWGNSLMQFMTNVGWIFLVTWLPTYLEKVHKVPVLERSVMASVPISLGMIGMLLGGPWTDRWTARSGKVWGRRGPVVVSRFLAMGGFLFALAALWGWCGPRETSTAAWVTVIGMGLVAIATDLGVPATWAYAQDVAGRQTAAVLGWANMWGNLGAAIAPIGTGMLLSKEPTLGEWQSLLWMCFAAFFVSGLGGLLMDASRPLRGEEAA